MSDLKESKSTSSVILEYQVPRNAKSGFNIDLYLKYRSISAVKSCLACAIAFVSSLPILANVYSERSFPVLLYSLFTFLMTIYYGWIAVLRKESLRSLVYPLIIVCLVLSSFIGVGRCPHASYIGIGEIRYVLSGRPCRNQPPRIYPWWMFR